MVQEREGICDDKVDGKWLAHGDLSNSADKSQHTPTRSSPFCRFTLLDFRPGAALPDNISRQTIQEHHLQMHDSGEKDCRFSEQPPSRRHSALDHGLPFETMFSPRDHVRVDHRAFLGIQHVRVALSVLGFDSSLWGNLSHFRGAVLHRYYHEVHGAPMYTVDFGGSIGICKLRVCDTVADLENEDLVATQRVLDFGEGGSCSTAGVEARTSSDPQLPEAASLMVDLDDDGDLDWERAFEDFDGEYTTSGTSLFRSPTSFQERPLRELGIYDAAEDTSGWDFAWKYRNVQWQESNQTLIGDRETLMGPNPGPTGALKAIPDEPIEYFRRYWPRHVLRRIVDKTNRLVYLLILMNLLQQSELVDFFVCEYRL